MKNKQNGFTLLELMVTVAIVGIIASIAIWNSSDMLEENRAENFLLELKRSITYARSQAASTDEIVILCPAQEGAIKQANDEFECQQEWDTNKIIVVFVDADNNGSYNVANDALLRVIEDIPATDSLSYSGDETNLRFNTSGRITTNPGDFIYCPNNDNENNKALTVSQSGTSFYTGDTAQTCD
ncbi:GspH/FimT family pseudopilin [Pseudoalteromonas sp. NSLLW218]|jgi:type IV fimbrial biogenesis protein FimT|uniref:GspH/FimT family pseudopilin n=1 Tax=Pseudoalteromonas sp. NSLLW218 TaxID=2792048 RepID=UPI0018CCB116|nr:GspH/FimT family pseudopilin [Pseudoalteromonas sp. NSLLW218]MBH0089237.1 GspH/FimT family pseudopilin [Pseudoalteromonas sp. NSLLW218]